MNVGRMREIVDVKVATTSVGSEGEYGAPTWRTLARVNAEIVSITGRERLQDAALQAGIAYRVRLRYRDDVTAKAKLVCLGPDFSGSTMEIHTVVRDHRAGMIELDCSEVLV